MSEHQYVGARYVPKFSEPIEWQSGKSYEALTIVTYNNASYTSKVPVPADVGTPAQNPDYWALTGNYNGQVEQYRQDTEQLKNSVDKNTNSINSITPELNSLYNYVHYKKIVCIGDSYGRGVHDGTEHLDQGWPAQLANMLPNSTVINYCVNGAGFKTGNTFQSQLEKAVSDGNSDADLIIIGYGANDIYNTESVFQDAQATLGYADTNFKNAKKVAALMSVCYPSGVSANQKFTRWHEIETAIINSNFTEVRLNTYIRCYGSILTSDNIHFTGYGYALLAKLLYNFIMTGGITPFERTIGVSDFFMTQAPNFTTIYKPGQVYQSVTLSKEYECTGNLSNNVLYKFDLNASEINDNRGIFSNWEYVNGLFPFGIYGACTKLNKNFWVKIGLGDNSIIIAPYSLNYTGTLINGFDRIPAGEIDIVFPEFNWKIPTYYLC